MRFLSVLVVLVSFLLSSNLEAKGLCATKAGVVTLRAVCKRSEVLVDLASLGPTGPQGIQGLTGSTGQQGPIGPKGDTGSIGPKGDTGATGPQGNQGPIGLTGATGTAGTNGTNGTNGTDGKTVLSGTGAPTTQGVAGDFYVDTSANRIYGPKVGSSWGAGVSLVGPQGLQGTQGPIGLTGNTGPTGATGATGPLGPAGPSGATGATGPAGPQGPIGLTGAQGPVYQPQIGDTCTVKSSLYSNTGIFVDSGIQNGVVRAGNIPGITTFIECIDQTIQWDLVSDFNASVTSGTPGNPFGNWTFMYRQIGVNNPVSYLPLNIYNSPSECPYTVGKSCWISQPPGTVPGQGTNARNYFGLLSNGVQAYADYGPNGTGLSFGNVIKWQSTFTGTISIGGSLGMLQSCGSGNSYSIYLGQTVIGSGSITPGGGSVPLSISNISVKSSDSIYIVTEPTVSYVCQEVVVNVRINRTS